MFAWGWTPYVDPDPMLSYFTCDQIATDPEDPTNYYNDANWCDPEYDKLYKQQNVELDPQKRDRHRAPDADALLRVGAPTTCSTRLRTRRHTARTASRAGRSSRPRPGRCCSRTPRRLTRSSSRSSTVRAVATTTAAEAAASSRSSSVAACSSSAPEPVGARGEREQPDERGVTRPATASIIGEGPRLAGTLVFVVVFNFFLFRVVETRPGRQPVPRAQPHARAARASCTKQFGLDGSKRRAVRRATSSRPRS